MLGHFNRSIAKEQIPINNWGIFFYYFKSYLSGKKMEKSPSQIPL